MCPSYWRVAPRRTFTTLASKPLEHGVAALKGKRALVTGSTQGLGLGIAQALLSSGCTVMLNGVANEEQMQSVTTQLRRTFPSGRFFIKAADLSSAPQVEDLMNTTAEELGGIDILVNNAGIQHVAPLESFPVERWDTILSGRRASFMAPGSHFSSESISSVSHNAVSCSSYEAKQVGTHHQYQQLLMLTSRWQHRVLMWWPLKQQVSLLQLERLAPSIHTRSKYLQGKIDIVIAGSTLASITLFHHNSQVHALAQKENLPFEEAATKLLQEKQPSKQFVTVSQISDTVLFLCGDNASQITGITLPVDGGWTSQ
ncbi:3-hydroxybutyrate dehydrogenase [Balamuthia mandrillaris]